MREEGSFSFSSKNYIFSTFLNFSVLFVLSFPCFFLSSCDVCQTLRSEVSSLSPVSGCRLQSERHVRMLSEHILHGTLWGWGVVNWMDVLYIYYTCTWGISWSAISSSQSALLFKIVYFGTNAVGSGQWAEEVWEEGGGLITNNVLSSHY